jgi:hypothetical protein
VNPPDDPQLDPLEPLALALLKEATLEIKRCVKSDSQFGHIGELILGSEKRINFSKSFPQHLQ